MHQLECDFTMHVYCAFDLAWKVLLFTMLRPYSDFLQWTMVYQKIILPKEP